MNTARRLGVDPWSVRAVATSAGRRAMNAQTWMSRLQRKLGLRARIIAGDEEARLTWLGASRGLDLPAGPLLVVDLGGGSTELVLGDEDQVLVRSSLELGSARHTERFLGTGQVDPAALAQLRHDVEITMATVTIHPVPRTVVGVGGTATTLATMVLGLDRYDSERVTGSQLTRVHLARIIDQLLPATPEQRRSLVPAAPERADYLLAGATILDRVLAKSRRAHMLISDRGLRYGLLAAWKRTG